MRIDIMIVDDVPRGVDTAADLETARRLLANSVSGEHPAR
jgi:3-deoxy-manno-octulosonate cytidylyltransferase (CMP-KDO synthetase)